MSNETKKIAVPEFGRRPDTLAGWSKVWSEEEMVEVFHRYCDIKDRDRKYRVEAAAKIKALKARAKAMGIEV